MTSLDFRPATIDDIDFIVALVTANHVGHMPDNARSVGDPHFREAFATIAADPNQRLVIAEREGRPIGTIQITFIPGLGLGGTWRGLLESVHILPGERSMGYGGMMVRWAIEQCRERGCFMVQLTSNKARTDAHRFYNRLGFSQSHEGFKLYL